MEKILKAFNWTKVELKRITRITVDSSFPSFNWTKVELKLFGFTVVGSLPSTFNWTKVELKLSYNDADASEKFLLIELR